MRTARNAKFTMVLAAVLVGGAALALASTSKPNAVRHPAEVGAVQLELTSHSGPAMLISLNGFQFGVSNAGTTKNGKVTHSVITVTKEVDSTSPALYQGVSTNEALTKAVLTTEVGEGTETLTCTNPVLRKFDQVVNGLDGTGDRHVHDRVPDVQARRRRPTVPSQRGQCAPGVSLGACLSSPGTSTR
jgi:hypothetical protein